MRMRARDTPPTTTPITIPLLLEPAKQENKECNTLSANKRNMYECSFKQIDVGEETPRTVVSGLVHYIPIEEMRDKYLVAVASTI